MYKDHQASTIPHGQRLKHISITDSGMDYAGVKFEKQSRIISCKNPFRQDPTLIDYDMCSQEEWEELNGDNLEDDDLLIDEENLEVEEDELEQLNLPPGDVSNLMKKKLAFRSKYNF